MRFNTLQKTRHKEQNLAGGDAFTLDPRMEMATILLTSLVQDQYYRGAGEGIEQVRDLLDRHPRLAEFAAKGALMARNEFGMRSISHVVAGEIAGRVKGELWTRRFLEKVVRRPDDVTEILGYYGAQVGDVKHPTAAMRKGLGAALARFDEYQLAKYRAGRSEISLIDAVNLLHPPHTEALGALMRGTLAPAETWETRLTSAGGSRNVAHAKRASWIELIGSRKLGYFALLRNLRNIMKQAPEVLPEALAMLVDEEQIRRSLVLPFRYYTAYRVLKEEAGGKVIGALEKALEIAIDNVPSLERTLVVVDRSGSMSATLSRRTDGTLAETAALFGVALARRSGADMMIFGDRAATVSIGRKESALKATERIGRRLNSGAYGFQGWTQKAGDVGHGTNFHAPLHLAQKKYDRIIFFSDMQGWVGYDAPTAALADYQRRTGARPYVYSFDLAGYGTMQFPNDRTFCLAGFSEKIFDTMKILEQDRRALVTRIENVEL